MSATDAQIDSYLDRLVIPTINEHGWLVQAVASAVDDDDPIAPFQYTVGLTGLGLPELLFIGSAGDVVTTMVNRFAQALVTGEWRLEHGRLFSDMRWLGTLRLHGPVYPYMPDSPMNMAANVFNRDEVGAWQILWPDPAGRYLDEGGEPGKCSPILPTLVELATLYLDTEDER